MSNFSCGCLLPAGTKEPTFKKSKYFQDLAASFAVNTKEERLSAHYSWLLQLNKDLPPGSYIEAELENPVDKDAPYKIPAIELRNKQGETFEKRRFYIVSPPLTDVECGLLNMKLRVYKDKTRQEVFTTHENQVLSRVNTNECLRTEFIEKMQALAKETSWSELKRNS
ncbi:hypothetical protein K493DRAFT_344469 [Basidiobolus meristosporus CBS 931.73]|uniref:Uncharacterized protein n=1 Tax=Basidiobolus meristosporus CBS 931.73 TaxID=1314790 RepID=A0A1Y1Z8Q5_9FUNG|nr:hypothetical protein K493DRAFT_344469 [Basidiobolus meristosporus CBS 931.73]|eukprot:ORY06631.1 hypothetical protein K493DRAFT_344469 [Basidiobolus meristosporus CBS 931.73]